VALDILDEAMARDVGRNERFAFLACRSLKQAEAKAREHRNSRPYRNAVVVMSFWEHYRLACEACGVKPIEQHRFPNHSMSPVSH
jgi:hypothetical protein